MSRISVTMVVVCLICPVLSAMAQGTFAVVSADNVNLRATASEQSEVVSQVHQDAQLTVLAVEAEWVQVTPPEGVFFWVHRDFVSNGQVKAKNLRVRAGPGINYSIVGNLVRGDQLETLGEFGDWLKIKPPEGSSLWVSTKLVEVTRGEPRQRMRQARRPPLMGVVSSTNIVRSVSPQQVVRTTRYIPPADESALPETREQDAATSASMPPPRHVPPPRASDLKPDWKLIPLEGQGKTVEREGTLKKFGFLAKRPTSFRLVRQDGPRSITLCYIRGNDAQLSGYVNETLRIRGREYWIRGVDYAVLVVDQVTPLFEEMN